MRILSLFLISLLLACVTGCSSKERVYQNVYEGLKSREVIVHPSNEPIPEKQPGYDEYMREREKILQKDKNGAN